MYIDSVLIARFDKLGNVSHSKNRSVNLVLPVEVSAEPPAPPEPNAGSDEMWADSRVDSPGAPTLPTASYVPDHEVSDASRWGHSRC